MTSQPVLKVVWMVEGRSKSSSALWAERTLTPSTAVVTLYLGTVEFGITVGHACIDGVEPVQIHVVGVAAAVTLEAAVKISGTSELLVVYHSTSVEANRVNPTVRHSSPFLTATSCVLL